jgi:hypothetical protein
VPSQEHLPYETLEHAYKDIICERDRLRDGRASVTRQLGPLPASAGIAIALVGALAEKVSQDWLFVALGLFALLVCVSIAYSVLWPYRRLRAKYEEELAEEAKARRPADPARSEKPHELGFDEGVPARDWLVHMIELERRIYGSLDASRHSFRLPFGIASLQDGFDAERTGLYAVQVLFVFIIGALVMGVLFGD